MDLGAGSMRNTDYLLRAGGFRRAYAVDASRESVPHARRLIEAFGSDRVTFFNMTFARFFDENPCLQESASLVLGDHSLPYHGKDGFPALMKATTESVEKHGWFAGTFFGEDDDWAFVDNQVVLLNKGQIASFFDGFDFEIREERQDRSAVLPAHWKRRYWHTYEVVAHRISSVL